MIEVINMLRDVSMEDSDVADLKLAKTFLIRKKIPISTRGTS